MKQRLVKLSVDTIRPSNRSARTHSATQIDKALQLMRRQGIVTPVVVDEHHELIDGHLRYYVAKEMGLAELDCIELSGLSRPQKIELALALNRLPADTKWDALVLKEQLEILIEQQFDLSFTGFAQPEITQALAFQILPNQPDDDLAANSQPVTEYGDLWKVGNHYIGCGEAKDFGAFWTSLDLPQATLLVTDPPYNVPTEGHIRTKGGHKDFKMAAGEMSDEAFICFLQESLGACLTALHEKALVYAFMDWRHLQHLTVATQNLSLLQQNLCVWAKPNAGMGSFYRSQHELVGVYSRSSSFRNNIELGQHGRYRTNVWTYPGVNSFGPTRERDLTDHPTIKPTQMIADIILDCTAHGDWVLDPFLGSGTAILAAEQTGRKGFGVDVDPHYVDVALKRLKDRLSLEAVHLQSGLNFAELEAERAKSSEVADG